MNYKENLKAWQEFGKLDEGLGRELAAVTDEKEMEDRFYTELAFGTAGMRGKIGMGTNRMNVYVVARATQGLAQYLLKEDPKNAEKGVAIAYDSRNFSPEFAQVAAQVLAANEIKAYLYDSLRPVPVLSFTVRHLKTAAGIAVTASHNPKEYNGYKVYGPDGGQITEHVASAVVAEIDTITDYFGVKLAAIDDEYIIPVGKEVDDAFAAAVEGVAHANPGSDLKIIYTPIHGSGNIPVRRVLKDLGYTHVSVVKEQEMPDGDFPTVVKPNPEEKSVFNIAIKMAEEQGADVIIGTDPDCDRVGVCCRTASGDYTVFTGNQTGALLVDYMLTSRDFPSNKAIVKTIVTSEMGGVIARAHGAAVYNVLTGFKYIGEKMTEWKESGEQTFVMGYEESYGYLAGDYARDKDAVLASALVCEMADYYKKQGKNLSEALEDLYEKYGYFLENVQAIDLDGIEGKKQIAAIMDAFRADHFDHFADAHLAEFNDYQTKESIDITTGVKTKLTLPVSNVLKFVFDENSWYAIRPSGTEPKIKVYYSVKGSSHKDAENKLAILKQAVNERLPKF
ncbi:MAG: phospho-sugar mutase [Eubacteriaceae bacterium]|jgi:phosphoglucomutase|nr:phospho-sugar mutase [Eubacteriaceae bacterium]MDD4508123.1 phospho-sugar mutase [Eubacteriaceae bacterium]